MTFDETRDSREQIGYMKWMVENREGIMAAIGSPPKSSAEIADALT